jgi:hypothetical protein
MVRDRTRRAQHITLFEEAIGMIIAAVYCRKSTEQNGIADDQKSVARQIEHARQYPSAKDGSSLTSTCT